MRIHPRQQLLEIWQATARVCFQEGRWVWGGRRENSSISDAEQLLCIMLPATEISRFRLDRPDETDKDILRALSSLGDHVDIPRRMVAVAIEFMKKYQTEDGVPTFPAGSYIASKQQDADTSEAESLDIVESFATSVTLTLAAIGFCRVFMTSLTRPELIAEVTELETLASRRLTAALAALLRSFSINVFSPDSDSGRNLLRSVNQERIPETAVLERLNQRLRDVRAGLRDYITVGSGQNVDLHPSKLFECGWSWGVIEKAPKVDFLDDSEQPDGQAIDAPYLYFTVVALDGIADLFSPRTRLLGLLNEEQQRLARALQIRWDLTQAYWAVIASFGDGRWPLEDIPWRTVDGEESDYFSLLVTAIVARDLSQGPEADVGLKRLGQVLAELANRGRLTRRPFVGDPAVFIHDPGVRVAIEFPVPIEGLEIYYGATDFAPLLLKRVIRVAKLINSIELRLGLLDLADQVWDSINLRRLRDGLARDLWDQPSQAFDQIKVTYSQPTWHHTVRVVESLVFAADLASGHPLRSEDLANFANDFLAEAEHLFDREQLTGSTEAGLPMRRRLEAIRQRLKRAREIIADRPATAISITVTVLTEIDELTAARSDTGSD